MTLDESNSFKIKLPDFISYECSYCGGFKVKNDSNILTDTFRAIDVSMEFGNEKIQFHVCPRCFKKVFDTVLKGEMGTKTKRHKNKK